MNDRIIDYINRPPVTITPELSGEVAVLLWSIEPLSPVPALERMDHLVTAFDRIRENAIPSRPRRWGPRRQPKIVTPDDPQYVVFIDRYGAESEALKYGDLRPALGDMHKRNAAMRAIDVYQAAESTGADPREAIAAELVASCKAHSRFGRSRDMHEFWGWLFALVVACDGFIKPDGTPEWNILYPRVDAVRVAMNGKVRDVRQLVSLASTGQMLEDEGSPF